MQYYPVSASGINNYGQCFGLTPQIIGEGDVTSMVSPNGTVQYLFTPITQWWPCTYFNSATHPYGNLQINSNTGSWFVRSIPNPLPPAVYNQAYQSPTLVQLSTPCHNSDSNIQMSPPGYQLKFHNDNWTSTTDLHYFYPCIRRSDWFPATQSINKGSAAIQVEMPVQKDTVCHHRIVCDKPCNCYPKGPEIYHKTQKSECVCKESASDMSIEDANTQHTPKCLRSKRKSKKKLCNVSTELIKDPVFCECNKTPEAHADKAVTTYIDQASGCTVEVGRETQTNFITTNSCANATPIQKVQSVVHTNKARPEVWPPKTSLAKKTMKSTSSDKIICESGCCSGSCSCNSQSDCE